MTDSPTAHFDKEAVFYDKRFTYSLIGNLQREKVWNYLNDFLSRREKLDILELNCGTGEDANKFAELGHRVVASDVSEQMVSESRAKTKRNTFDGALDFEVIDINQLDEVVFDRSFDLVFSNFGGLNCLTEDGLKKLSLDLKKILKPDGHFISVIMPNFCLMEHLTFFLKLKWNEMFRRNNSAGLSVPIEDGDVWTYYYSPKQFCSFFENNFKIKNKKPIGLFIPPSYMEGYFKKHEMQLDFLNLLDNGLNSISSLAGIADHCLIDMSIKD